MSSDRSVTATDDTVYQLVRRASIDPREVERAGTSVTEVSVLWGRTVLHVAHLATGETFSLVALAPKHPHGSYFVADETVLAGAASITLLDASGTLDLPAHATLACDRDGTAVEAPDVLAPIRLAAGVRYRSTLSMLTVHVRVVAAPRKFAGGRRRDTTLLASGIGSAMFVSALIGAGTLAGGDANAMLSSNDDDARLESLVRMTQTIRDREAEPELARENDSSGGTTGAAAAGERGAAGRHDVAHVQHRIQVRDNHLPERIAPRSAREVVGQTGVLAALNGMTGLVAAGAGAPSPFGALASSHDSTDHAGGLTGTIGEDGFGMDGLDHVGTGIGGGGPGHDTIGVGELGTIGGIGVGCDGVNCVGGTGGHGLHPRGNHGPVIPQHVQLAMTGVMAPDAIRRVVQRNLGQVRFCHEQGMQTNPGLAGRVTVRFVIGATGTVMSSSVGDSTVNAPSVAACIASAVRRWQFPTPEGGGIVTVNYPFMLERAN